MLSSLLTSAIILSPASGFLAEANNRMFSFRSEAVTACGDNVCAANELSSELTGWYCPEYTATNPATHQKVFCNYNGDWVRSTAAPSNCRFRDKYSCQVASNNCWNRPSSDCEYYCKCTNYDSNTANRMGNALLGASKKDASKKDEKLGHYHNGCPEYLPQAQSQLTPGSLGVVCWNKGKFCRYPSYGMNFVCTGYNGVWQLQGASPTPPPVPSPSSQCPGYWYIWGGITQCNRNGRICRYPSYGKNYVCSNGVWQGQGGPSPTPRPTPAPVNPATCPPRSSDIRAGRYCTQTGQRCDYSGVAYACDTTGVWRSILY